MENRAIEQARGSTAGTVTQWTPEQVEVIRRTVAKNASNDELKMFIHLSQSYGLDPFAKEIWFIKMNSENPIVMTSRDGYLAIANRNAHYRGLDSDVVYSHDRFRRINGTIEHIYGFDNNGSRGVPIGAYAVVKRDDRDPFYCWAPWGDYNKGSGTWGKYKHAMILKVAEAMALKRAFSISGMVTQEELDDEESRARQERWEAQRQADTARQAAIALKTQLYHRYLAVCGNQPQHAQNAMLKVVPGKASKDWTADDLAALEADVARREEALSHSSVDFDAAIDAETVEPEVTSDHSGEVNEMMEPEAAEHVAEAGKMVEEKQE